MKALLITLCLIAGIAEAACFPPNDKWIAEDVTTSNVSKAAFKSAISIVQKAYAPEVARNGGKLVINNMWSDGTVNSQAYRRGNTWYVDAFGGLARFHSMTKAGYIAVLCHEVGHHLGGYPKYDRNTDWASVEGQADYWATLECMRRVDPSDSMAASQTLANVLAELGGEPMPSINTPDESVVSETYEDHPGAQCRLDTYYDGYKQTDRPRCWFAP